MGRLGSPTTSLYGDLVGSPFWRALRLVPGHDAGPLAPSLASQPSQVRCLGLPPASIHNLHSPWAMQDWPW